MGSLLGDAAVRDKEDAVTEAGGRQPMGDKHGGLASRHVAVLLVNIVFGDGIERCRRLVQNQNRTVFIQCSGQHQPLGLAAGELHSIEINIPAKVGIYTVGKFGDSLCKTGFGKTAVDFFRVDVFGGLCNAFCNGRIQDGKALKHSGKQVVILSAVKLPDILPIQQHTPLGRIVEAAQKHDHGGFACAVQTYHCQLFAGMDGQVHLL